MTDERVRLAELVAALSVATDMGKGLPLEQAQRSCLVAMRLAELVGLGPDDRHVAYYCALLRFVGCTATAHEFAAVFGDDIAGSSWFSMADPDDMQAVLRIIFRNAGRGQPALARARAVARVLARGRAARVDHEQASCEVARLLAERLGLGPDVAGALAQVFERWDGKGGVPGERSGDAIALPVRLGHLAHYGVLFERAEGVEAAVAVARERSGTMFDPDVAEVFCENAGELFAGLPGSGTFEAVVAAEPEPWRWLTGERIDRATRAMGHFADLKSPFTVGHSDGVAELAAGAARVRGLAAAEVTAVRRAGWLHDLGRCGVSTAVWDKPGPLSDAEWECVRLHSYYTDRVVSRCPPLAEVGALAAQHHERVDGSGYPKGLAGRSMPVAAGMLAAADVFSALRERRPHRPAHSTEAAAEIVCEEARRGRLDPQAVDAVMDAAGAGNRAGTIPSVAPAGLTEREVEVLGLLARGLTNAEVAAALFVSPKTVGTHAEHIYRKIGVSTRAAATVFALSNDLVQIG